MLQIYRKTPLCCILVLGFDIVTCNAQVTPPSETVGRDDAAQERPVGNIDLKENEVYRKWIDATNQRYIWAAHFRLWELKLDTKDQVPHFVAFLGDEDVSVRRAGAVGLALVATYERSTVARYIDELIAGTEDEDERVRSSCIIALRELGPSGKAVIPFWLEILKLPPAEDDNVVQYEAAMAVGAIGKDAIAAKEPLLALLKNDEDTFSMTREEAALALPLIGANDDETINTLLQLLTDEDVREEAAISLVRLNRTAEAKPIILQSFKARSILQRLEIIEHLGDSGDSALPLSDSLEELENDESPLIAAAAKWANDAIVGRHTKEMISEYGAMLDSDDPDIRLAGAFAIGKIGPAARHMLPKLEAALRLIEKPSLTSVGVLNDAIDGVRAEPPAQSSK